MMTEQEIEIIANVLSVRNNLYTLMNYDKEIFPTREGQYCYEALKELYDDGEQVDFAVFKTKIDTEKYKGKISVDNYVDMLKSGYTINFNYIIRDMEKKHLERQIEDLAKDLYNSVKRGRSYDEFIDKIHENTENFHRLPSKFREIDRKCSEIIKAQNLFCNTIKNFENSNKSS